MTMQAWSPDPGGANYRSKRHSCSHFGKVQEEIECWHQENTEAGGILAFTSVMQEKKKPAVCKKIPK